MPCCHLALRAAKPRPGYPKQPNTLGDHLRARRLDLGLSQARVAQRLGVHLETLNGWECHRTRPPDRLIPRIIEFIGHDPIEVDEGLRGRLCEYRRWHGLTLAEFARRAALDRETVADFERGRRRTSRWTVEALKRFL